MTRELLKDFTTQQLLSYVVSVINDLISLSKHPENKEMIAEMQERVIMINREIEERNQQLV